jgi:hypothetical protein
MENNTNKNINTEHIIKVSEDTKKDIFNNVEASYKNDIKEMIIGKTCWRRIGITFETFSKVTIAAGGVLSFSSGYFNSNILSFISGSISVISLSLLQFGTFGFKQSKKRANDLNILLKKLNLDTIPVIDDDSESLSNGNNKTVENKGIVNNDSDTNRLNNGQGSENKNDDAEKNKEANKNIFLKSSENLKAVDTKNLELELETFTPKKNKNIKIIENKVQIPVSNEIFNA